jgi:hypothetical protein
LELFFEDGFDFAAGGFGEAGFAADADLEQRLHFPAFLEMRRVDRLAIPLKFPALSNFMRSPGLRER